MGKRMPESMHVCQVYGCVGVIMQSSNFVVLALLFQLSQRQNLLGKMRLVKIIPLLVAFLTSASLTVPLAACFLIGPYGRKVAKVWILAGCFGNIIGLSLVILGAMLAILLATYTLTWQVDAFHVGIVPYPASLVVGAKLFLNPSRHITHLCRALITSQFLVGFLPLESMGFYGSFMFYFL